MKSASEFGLDLFNIFNDILFSADIKRPAENDPISAKICRCLDKNFVGFQKR